MNEQFDQFRELQAQWTRAASSYASLGRDAWGWSSELNRDIGNHELQERLFAGLVLADALEERGESEVSNTLRKLTSKLIQGVQARDARSPVSERKIADLNRHITAALERLQGVNRNRDVLWWTSRLNGQR